MNFFHSNLRLFASANQRVGKEIERKPAIVDYLRKHITSYPLIYCCDSEQVSGCQSFSQRKGVQMSKNIKINSSAKVLLILGLAAIILGIAGYIKFSKQKELNIVFIYLDALRQDHLGCYGYNRETSPNIDKLAQNGVLFKNAFAQAPCTFPSVHSTLTSKYASNFLTICRLEREHLTLSEALKHAGYYTVAFSSSPIVTGRKTNHSLGGFDQGFDLFDDSIYSGKKWNWQWRSPEGVIEHALEWLDENQRRNFFLFLYIMDPHCDYRPPEPYRSLYDPDFKGKNPVMGGHPTYYESKILRGLSTDLADRDIKHFVALYDGEIKYADAQIGRLLRKLQQLNLDKNTLVILTSDHGEEFFDHGGVKHCYTLYNELIKIPLIMRYPSLISGGSEVNEIIQSIDILPTILEIVDIEKPEVIKGESLLPLIRGKDTNWRDYAISESPIVDAKAIVTKKWKYIHHFETRLIRDDLCDKYKKGKELYDLENDPKELTNLYVENIEIAEELYNKMIHLLSESERERLKLGKALELDKKTKEELQSLGYLK